MWAKYQLYSEKRRTVNIQSWLDSQPYNTTTGGDAINHSPASFFAGNDYLFVNLGYSSEIINE